MFALFFICWLQSTWQSGCGPVLSPGMEACHGKLIFVWNQICLLQIWKLVFLWHLWWLFVKVRFFFGSIGCWCWIVLFVPFPWTQKPSWWSWSSWSSRSSSWLPGRALSRQVHGGIVLSECRCPGEDIWETDFLEQKREICVLKLEKLRSFLVSGFRRVHNLPNEVSGEEGWQVRQEGMWDRGET